MSLSDTKNTIETTVIEPLNHFRTLASSLDQIHNDCLGNSRKAWRACSPDLMEMSLFKGRVLMHW
ncbi:MAG TPA: hypothetical protein VFV38_46220 [Ktedonobacteraceae bacterium]|nr:hypothetical protein [Ktedonobacteraceae bacterium]